MARIVDLPDDIFEIIFQYLVRTNVELLEGGLSKIQVSALVGSQLRLVCRKWADWLYTHHLYRQLSFDNSSRATDFIDQLSRRSESQPRARCQQLMVHDLWPRGLFPSHQHGQDTARMMNDLASLEALASIYSDTIAELELEFVNTLSLSQRTIETIASIESLRVLRLGLKSEWISELHEGMERNWDSHGSQHDVDNLRSLILACRRLDTLDLTRLPFDCLPLKFAPCMTGSLLPTITQLDIKLGSTQPLDSLINLCAAFKHSLKVLSIQSLRDDGQRLVPVFETLRETLEGLFISQESILTHIVNYKFPRLRVFRIHYWDYCITDLLRQEMFLLAPIEVIAIYSHTVYRRKRAFHVNPFSKLPKLRKLVFIHARLDDSPPENYIRACKARRIQCVYFNHGNISEIMKL